MEYVELCRILDGVLRFLEGAHGIFPCLGRQAGRQACRKTERKEGRQAGRQAEGGREPQGGREGEREGGSKQASKGGREGSRELGREGNLGSLLLPICTLESLRTLLCMLMYCVHYDGSV